MYVAFSIPNYPSLIEETPNPMPILFVPNIKFIFKFADGDLGIGKKIIEGLVIRNQFSDSITFKNKLEHLREQIDDLDNELVDLLARRMVISKKIGKYKKDNNVTILQIRRWKKILQTQTKHGKLIGFDEDFIRTLFTLVHDESIKVQTSVMNK